MGSPGMDAMPRIKVGSKAGEKDKKKKRRAARKERPFQFEALEPRLLLSAEMGIPPADPENLTATPAPVVENVDRFNDVTTTPAADGIKDDGEVKTVADNGEKEGPAAPEKPDPSHALTANDVVDAEPAPGTTLFSDTVDKITAERALRQVVVIDPAVVDTNHLLTAIDGSRQDARIINLAGNADLPADTSAGSLLDIYLLDGSRDGVAQLTDILENYDTLDAVHIFSHGDTGAVYLGTTPVTGENLADRQNDLTAWGAALAPDGDLLLYGCDVAAGDDGVAFVETLAAFTGADVAASTDRTGPVDLDGNWDLEFQTGPVETPVLSNATTGYSHLLETFVSTGDNETFEGTGANDIFSFDDNWGSDTIVNGGGSNTVNFSAVSADLIFTFHADGTVSATDGENVLNPAEGISTIIAGSGDNRFVFERGPSFPVPSMRPPAPPTPWIFQVWHR